METLGAINDFAREALRFYPNLNPEILRMVLVSPDQTILPELGPKLGAYAQRKLAARGIEIVSGVKVTAFEDGEVKLSNGESIRANTLIWTAGTAPNPLIAGLPLPKRNVRVEVNEFLQVPGFPRVWAIGDCALVPNSRTGGFHPPTAQHALREGRVLADNIAASITGRAKMKPFSFSTMRRELAYDRLALGVVDDVRDDHAAVVPQASDYTISGSLRAQSGNFGHDSMSLRGSGKPQSAAGLAPDFPRRQITRSEREDA